MSNANIFSSYKQEENHFTNSLISVLSLSRTEGPELVPTFLQEVVGLNDAGDIDTFKVLKEIRGTADGELSGPDCCLRIESKIVSGTLRQEQINDHLKHLRDRTECLQKLILLTPDDRHSEYIKTYISRDPNSLIHVGWKSVLGFLETFIDRKSKSILTELIQQFVDRIRENVLSQDMAGIVLKVDFGAKSGVDSSKYLNEVESGEWNYFNTPREYKMLDGTGRKMLLYDKTRQAITVEAEVQRVSRTDSEPDYPWTNEFVPGTVRVIDPPISLGVIRTVAGFENFGMHKKDRSPYRNLTHTQLDEMMREHTGASTSKDVGDQSRSNHSTDRFTLHERHWYAAEFIGEEFGTEVRSYSAIRVYKVDETNSGWNRFQLSFYHANYPEGVRDKVYTLQTIERNREFLLAQSIGHTPVRLLLVYPISWEWMRRHFGAEASRESLDVQDWLSGNA